MDLGSDVNFSGIGRSELEDLRGDTIIKVVGVGGAGGSVVRRMIESGIDTVDYAVVNTDKMVLDSNPAPIKITIGKKLTRGLGAGMRPEIGREAAIEDLDDLRTCLEGAHMVFIAAGMGGGTGTGAAPVLAEIAKELNILTVAIVSTPFEFEGGKRMNLAVAGIEELKKHIDTLMIVPNEKLLEIATPNMGMKQAFTMADDVLRDAIRGVSNLINGEADINLDFMDVKTVMKDKGRAFIGIGIAKGQNRGEEAAIKAMESPVLNSYSVQNASGIIVYIEGDPEFPMQEVKKSAESIQQKAGENADVIFGYKENQKFKSEVRITIIVAGFEGDLIQSKKIDSRKPIKVEDIFNKYEQQNLQSSSEKTEKESLLILDDEFSVNPVVDKPHIPTDYQSLDKKEETDTDIPTFIRKQDSTRYQDEDE